MKLGTSIAIAAPVLPIPLPDESVTIVNVTDQAFTADRTYGIYRIEGRGLKPYSTAVLHAARGVIDRGERKPKSLQGAEQFIIHAEDIALDLVRQWNADIWGIGSTPTGEVGEETVRGFSGVFVADGAIPTDEELVQAATLLAASDSALIERAHAEWDTFHRPEVIHAGWKRAAKRMGIDAEWMYTVVNKNALPDCPFCGSKLKTATATVCATCHRDVVPQNGSERHSEDALPEAKAKPKPRAKAAA